MLSRVADNLYWMSRYLERAEHTARLIDVQLHLMLEESPTTRDSRRWKRLTQCLHVTGEIPVDDPYAFSSSLTFEVSNTVSVAACIYAARENARQVRERISTEMWQELNRLYLFIKGSRPEDVLSIQPHNFFQDVKDRVHMFQGITDSTMSHGEGWYFIQLGRFMERAASVASLLDVHFREFAHYDGNRLTMDAYFEWLGLLKSCTAFEAYVKVYTAELRPERVAEFLLLNEQFPHSVRFSADCVQEALTAIAEITGTLRSGRVHRLAGRLRAALSFDQIDEIIASGLHEYLGDIQRQCAQIHTAAYETYIEYPIEAALR